jgi:peptidoglycan/xylan/chitin deacetylase (PgdA/CDA1 family)
LVKDFLRATIGLGGKHLGPVMRRLDRSLTVFLLHDVSDAPSHFTRENHLWVSSGLFRKQMEFVANNFNVISMENLLNGDIPSRAAMITFDDGYAGTFRNALPILGSMSLPCTIFVNMAPMSGEVFWAGRVVYLCQKVRSFRDFLAERLEAPIDHAHLECTQELVDLYESEEGNDYLWELPSYIGPLASLEDLQEADDNPLVTLANHLYNHYNVRTLQPEVLKEQYEKNSIALSRFQRYLPVFAFPFGQPGTCFSADQAMFLLKIGAVRLFTGYPKPNSDHAARVLHRIALGDWHDCDSRLWYQTLKFPVLNMLGNVSSPLGHELAEIQS